MPDAHARILRQMQRPAVLRLAQALGRLRSVATLMSTGAHPDDEATAMLTALARRDGVRLVIACSTRGEGGQNALGPELGGDLGALRSREMEEAARVLGADVAWLGHGPDDPVHDFGFSKSGEDTFGRWGREQVVERLVQAIRRERPDILVPTFLDVPGQHGHHRAMTQAALAAVRLAGDPAAFPQHGEQGLAPWQPAKLYLPAWSGAGDSYDDDLPPPDATLVVEAGERDPVTGATHAQMGEWSRRCHASQGMGRWREPGPSPWPLHRAFAVPGMPAHEGSVLDGLPRTPADLAGLAGMAAGAHLRGATAAIQLAIAAWPNAARVMDHALKALGRVRAGLRLAEEPAIRHRLARKERELEAVIVEAAGIEARAWAEPGEVAPGAPARVAVVVHGGQRLGAARVEPRLPAGWGARADGVGFVVDIPEDAMLSSPFQPGFDPLGGNGAVGVRLRFVAEGQEVAADLDLDPPLLVRPAVAVTAEPGAFVVNTRRPPGRLDCRLVLSGAAGAARTVRVEVRDDAGHAQAREPGAVALPSDGGAVVVEAAIQLGAEPTPDPVELAILLDGSRAWTVRRFAYRHTGTITRTVPATIRIRTVDAALPEGSRIGYAGGGNDRVDEWLRRLGMSVTPLDDATLETGELGRLNVLLIGIFAYGTRPALGRASARLHRWVREGGHLVTLYHRPWDGWDPATTPPARLEIGKPSLRWRVTDPAAAVRVLVPDHPLLSRPNRIDAGDWTGWRKERGLYFASSWDSVYEPLLAMSDPGEAPLEGALLSARIGRGRHTHTSLVLHQQLEQLVPGAFRLIANLVQPA